MGREGKPFEFMPVARGLELTQRTLTAFFLAYLNDRQDALHHLEMLSNVHDVQVRPRVD